jgi:farnesyl-diphosphate farnesyltransferase
MESPARTVDRPTSADLADRRRPFSSRPTSTAADRAYCRAALPRVSRTFAINIRVLGGSMAEAVRVAYLLCRTADTIEDSSFGRREDIERHFDLFLEAISGAPGAAESLADGFGATRGDAEQAHLDLVAHFPNVWRQYRALDEADRDAVAEGVTTLASGMKRYAARMADRLPRAGAGGRAPSTMLATDRTAAPPYLDTETELHDYCWVVAGCVGVMLTRLFTLRVPASAEVAARRLALAPFVGEGLQLTNILLDWPQDVRLGRCYLPAEWLSAAGLRPNDLVGASRVGVPEIASRLETLARAALARVPDYLDSIPARCVRYRLFCLWPALWALGSLRHARLRPEFPWGTERPRLSRSELRRSALRSLWAAHRPETLRRLYDDVG